MIMMKRSKWYAALSRDHLTTFARRNGRSIGSYLNCELGKFVVLPDQGSIQIYPSLAQKVHSFVSRNTIGVTQLIVYNLPPPASSRVKMDNSESILVCQVRNVF
jgi:hypothetical protein